MLFKNVKDWLIKNRLNLACKILNFQCQNSTSLCFQRISTILVSKYTLGYVLSKIEEILKIKQRTFVPTDDPKSTPV